MNKVELEQFAAMLASGFVDQSDGDEYDLLRRAFLTGVQRWSGYQILGELEPSYFVAAVENKTRAQFLPGVSNENYGPISRQNLLIPVQTDTPMHVSSNGNMVRVELVLSSCIDDLPSENCEVDLFLSSDVAKDLRAFRLLAEGKWHLGGKPLSGNGRFPYPRLGFRPGIDPSDPNRRSHETNPQLLSLHDQHEHPIAERFLRLPAQQVVEAIDDKRVVAEIRVSDSSEAQQISSDLTNNLRLNHIAFWNQRIHKATKQDIRPAKHANDDLLVIKHALTGECSVSVLSCVDLLHRQSYTESSWFSSSDPGYCFTSEVADFGGGQQRIGLRFANAPQAGTRDFDIYYLIQKSGEPPERFPRTLGFDFEMVKVRSLPRPKPWNSKLVPGLERVVSRLDVRNVLKLLMPVALVRLAGERFSIDDVMISSELRRIPARLTNTRVAGQTVIQALVIHVPIQCPLMGEVGRHYTELWEHKLEERCSASTIVIIDWKEG